MVRRLIHLRAILPLAVLAIVSMGAVPRTVRSDAIYPKDWRTWTKVKQTFIPSADTPLPKNIPPLFVETIRMYNWINDGKGTRLDIYVNPAVLEAYKTHGPYPDGVTAVGVYADVGIVFVTQHLLGEALYGTYDTEGKDLSDQNNTFNPATCYRCHLGYRDICVNGTCAVPDPSVLSKAHSKP